MHWQSVWLFWRISKPRMALLSASGSSSVCRWSWPGTDPPAPPGPPRCRHGDGGGFLLLRFCAFVAMPESGPTAADTTRRQRMKKGGLPPPSFVAVLPSLKTKHGQYDTRPPRTAPHPGPGPTPRTR